MTSSRFQASLFSPLPAEGTRGAGGDGLAGGVRGNAMPSAFMGMLLSADIDVRVAIAQACGVWFFFILLVQAIGTVQLYVG